MLAITSLMMISAMLGVRGAINNQRYNDSINSFRDFLRDQYNGVINTDVAYRNTAVKNYCGDNIQRGRTNCLLLGKLLKFEAAKVSIYGVIGNHNPSSGITINSDEEYFTSRISSLRVVGDLGSSGNNPNPEQEYRLDWDATLKHPDGKSNLDKYVLLIRSPLSGSVRTYAMQQETAANRSGLDQVLADLVKEPKNLNHSPAFCVHPEGFAFTNRRAVVIKSNGSNASAVEIAPLDGKVNGVEAIRCK